MNEHISTHWVSEHYNTAIAYGDTSGLNEDEEQMFDDWMGQFSKGVYLVIVDAGTEWDRCEVSYSCGQCIEVRAYRNREEN